METKISARGVCIISLWFIWKFQNSEGKQELVETLGVLTLEFK